MFRAQTLTDARFLHASSNAFIRQGIAQGRPGTAMSAFGQDYKGPLSSQAIDDIIAYLRQYSDARSRNLDLLPDKIGNFNASKGKEMYLQSCALCHGQHAEGSKLGPSLSNPLFIEQTSAAYLTDAISRGRGDNKMPAYLGIFNHEEIMSIVAYLRNLNPGDKSK